MEEDEASDPLGVDRIRGRAQVAHTDGCVDLVQKSGGSGWTGFHVAPGTIRPGQAAHGHRSRSGWPKGGDPNMANF